jgi:hypothetical protein
MERRGFKRIPANLHTRFFYGNLSYTGIVTNLSENGMYVKTKKGLPLEAKLEMFVPLIDEVLKIPVEIRRVVRKDDMCDGMGIELLELPLNYFKLVEDLHLH